MSKKEKQSSKKIDEKQKESEVKISHFQENIKANNQLKEILTLALKQTSITTREVLPKLAKSVVSYIREFKENLKNKTVTDDMMKLLSKKELTNHCYNLVGYNRKNEVNDLFEKVVSRANRLALMLVDYPNEFNVDDQTNEVFVMSKTLEPKIDIKIKGSKVTKKVNNKDESLIPVSTYVVDKMYAQKYPTGKRQGKTKDEKINIKSIAKDFVNGLKKLIALSSKQDVKFFDLVDEVTFEKLEEAKMLLNSEEFQVVRSFSVEYRPDYNGNLEKIEEAKQVINK
jgi:Sec-independent protein translocase protein TatA